MIDKNLIFEKSNDSLSSYNFFKEDGFDITKHLPQNLIREELEVFPDMSEGEVVRHYIRLSNRNFGVDTGFYPLGSCTMKYNPKINEKISKMDPFANMHPYSSEDRVQGNLEVMYKAAQDLGRLPVWSKVSIAPCAGAHGELTGLYVIDAYFKDKGEVRDVILVPDSAHGTNPASANVAGFKVVTVKSDANGFVSIEDLQAKIGDNVAALMLTNPNTLGLYEKNIETIVDICHKKDIQLYYDGANLNAILGISRPGDAGFDVAHLNLHKSFSTPHGGGGPGSGPVGVKKHLKAFLPNEKVTFADKKYKITGRGDKSIGKVRAFYCNFSVIIKSYAYIVTLGAEGLRKSGLLALLNANYLGYLLKDKFDIATKDHIMHEFVILLEKELRDSGLGIMDFAKRILDYGYHAPTVSFPLHNCLMIEPTETETIEVLDKFAETMLKIYDEMKNAPDLLKNSPTKTPIKRVDDITAARQPILKYDFQ